VLGVPPGVAVVLGVDVDPLAVVVAVLAVEVIGDGVLVVEVVGDGVVDVDPVWGMLLTHEPCG
jgi:hypothetical protein